MTLRIVSYNMLKGRSLLLKRPVHTQIFHELLKLEPHLLVLQEFPDFCVKECEDYFSDSELSTNLPYFAYGFNAKTRRGRHGNAVLSHHPIASSENFNISKSKFAKRGLLHCKVNIRPSGDPLHIYCTHFDLFQNARNQQIMEFLKIMEERTPLKHPIVFCGDFNDWNRKIEKKIQELFSEAHLPFETFEKSPKTYPAPLPVLPLDRIYLGHTNLQSLWVPKDKVWSRLSDHRPIIADIEIP